MSLIFWNGKPREIGLCVRELSMEEIVDFFKRCGSLLGDWRGES
jgi:hypothetical protein